MRYRREQPLVVEEFKAAEPSRGAFIEIIRKAREDSRINLLEPEAKDIARAFGISISENSVATDVKEAVRFARQIGYPVVLKIVSPDILHKSEAKGVKLNLSDDAEVETAYREIITNTRAYSTTARVVGVLVEKMAPKGVEVIVGGMHDLTFGPVVLFGLGGIFVEEIRDVTFRVAPINTVDAGEMLEEIKGRAVLQGIRGEPPADKEAISKIILAVSKMLCEIDQLDQVDLNPVMVYEHGASVVDARMILTKNSNRNPRSEFCG